MQDSNLRPSDYESPVLFILSNKKLLERGTSVTYQGFESQT